MSTESMVLPPSGGVIVIDKPEGYTSHDAVNRARKLFCTKQVGHTGTLDPLATGVLCLLVGRAVKACEYSLDHSKSYRAVMRLGIQTDTGDITGKVIRTCEEDVPEEKVISAASAFTGNLMQIPPMYSALKVGGRKLCDIARSGEQIERSPRPIKVSSLSITHIGGRDYSVEATVSSGTYIRTLCEDIGGYVGNCASMVSLRRTEGSGFDLSDAHTLDELERMTPEERILSLLPVERLFAGKQCVKLSGFHERLFRNGCAILLKKLGTEGLPEGTLLRVSGQSGFFAVGMIIETPDGPALKSDKIFVL